MTEEQIDLVRTSFEKIGRLSEEAAVLFYARLFELDPKLRRLFKPDMGEQRLKLMQMLEAAVNGLGHLDELLPAVREMGARHAGYGVEDHQYETVGSALLYTFECALGAEYTAEMKEAWTAVYALLATTMKDASRP